MKQILKEIGISLLIGFGSLIIAIPLLFIATCFLGAITGM